VPAVLGSSEIAPEPNHAEPVKSRLQPLEHRARAILESAEASQPKKIGMHPSHATDLTYRVDYPNPEATRVRIAQRANNENRHSADRPFP